MSSLLFIEQVLKVCLCVQNKSKRTERITEAMFTFPQPRLWNNAVNKLSFRLFFVPTDLLLLFEKGGKLQPASPATERNTNFKLENDDS